MPYYVYKVSAGMGLVKNLELIDEFQMFKEAKIKVKALRADDPLESKDLYKIIFADNQLIAEEQLQEKRQKPTLMEHEI